MVNKSVPLNLASGRFVEKRWVKVCGSNFVDKWWVKLTGSNFVGQLCGSKSAGTTVSFSGSKFVADFSVIVGLIDWVKYCGSTMCVNYV